MNNPGFTSNIFKYWNFYYNHETNKKNFLCFSVCQEIMKQGQLLDTRNAGIVFEM